jgi:hypothetical protein
MVSKLDLNTRLKQWKAPLEQRRKHVDPRTRGTVKKCNSFSKINYISKGEILPSFFKSQSINTDFRSSPNNGKKKKILKKEEHSFVKVNN